MPKKTTYCSECKKLFRNGQKHCEKSKGLRQKACKHFKRGPLFVPKFAGKKAKTIAFEPTSPNAWCFWISPTQMLLLAWEIDNNDFGHWRIFHLGMNDRGVVLKKFGVDQVQPAFYGEVAIKGAGQNDLFASLGFEDDDAIDYEQNVYNKPSEVVIIPKREDD